MFRSATSGSLLRTEEERSKPTGFSEVCGGCGVLPTWGTTELVEAEFFGEPLLHQGLFGQYGGYPVGALVALRRIEQGVLLDLLQLLQQLLERETGPGRLRLFANILQQRDPQHAVEGMDPYLLIGPVIHRSPLQPFAILEPAEHLFDLLLAGVAGNYLLGGPVEAVGPEHGSSQTMSQQTL